MITIELTKERATVIINKTKKNPGKVIHDVRLNSNDKIIRRDNKFEIFDPSSNSKLYVSGPHVVIDMTKHE